MKKTVYKTIKELELLLGHSRDEWELRGRVDFHPNEVVRLVYDPTEERYQLERYCEKSDVWFVASDEWYDLIIPSVLTAEGHTYSEVYEALREAFESRWPDISFTAGESESHSASTADWINSGDWSNRPSIKYVIREYVLVMLEHFEWFPGLDDDWH